MKKRVFLLGRILLGCILFALGLNLFLLPNDLNAGGISGLSMACVYLTNFGTVGLFTILFNLPLFVIAGLAVGKRFFTLSLIGTLTGSVMIDMISQIPAPNTDPLIGAIYGGLLCGLGLGTVFSTGGSTGGSDIIIRLLKHRYRAVPLGTLAIIFDILVATLTGVVFRDFTRTLYSIIAIVVSGRMVDAVLYRFDYSRVAWIITPKHHQIALAIAQGLGRGATFFYAEGSLSHKNTVVVMTAVRLQQLPEHLQPSP